MGRVGALHGLRDYNGIGDGICTRIVQTENLRYLLLYDADKDSRPTRESNSHFSG
jgi:hypothetical protein